MSSGQLTSAEKRKKRMENKMAPTAKRNRKNSSKEKDDEGERRSQKIK